MCFLKTDGQNDEFKILCVSVQTNYSGCHPISSMEDVDNKKESKGRENEEKKGEKICQQHSDTLSSVPSFVLSQHISPYVQILEQPASRGIRFRYQCEGRSAGCIPGFHSTVEKKTFPSIKVENYQGLAVVVVSCVTKDGPPYLAHPHNLVGRQNCKKGVCTMIINQPDMKCSFTGLGVQCVKKKDVYESLKQREALRVDPFGMGFAHSLKPNKIDLNAVRLCFQVFIQDSCSKKFSIPLPPVISHTIYDKKTVSDLTITRLSHYSAPMCGGIEVILLCDHITKDDIQVWFSEEEDGNIVWESQALFSPGDVHKKAAISFLTPPYVDVNNQHSVDTLIQLRRPSDGAVGEPRIFKLMPVKCDPNGLIKKRRKLESSSFDNLISHGLMKNLMHTAGPRMIKHAVRMKSRIDKGNKVLFPDPVPADMVDSTQKTVSNDVRSTVMISDLPLSGPSIISSSSSGLCVENNFSSFPSGHTEKTENFQDGEVLSAADTTEKLDSLDLGIDPDELDVNISDMTFDSVSLSVNFDSGSSIEEVPYLGDKDKLDSNVCKPP